MDLTTLTGLASVVIDLPTRALSEPFDYAVPAALIDDIRVGMPVLVPLGNTMAVGYVVGMPEESSVDGLRLIEQILGPALFDERAITLATWIAAEYIAPLSEALRLFLPPGGTPRLVRGYAVSGERPDGGDAWVFDLASREGGVSDSELGRPGSRGRAAAVRLLTRGVLTRTYALKPARVSQVSERLAMLTDSAEGFTPTRRATMQMAVLQALENGPVSVAELRAELGSVDGAIRRLAESGVIEVVERLRLRRPVGASRSAPRHAHLSEGQQAALDEISSATRSGGVILIEGVTGSGKTEVYLRAIERCLSTGKRAIVLVPEISLTPQTVGRFRSRFGDRVAVLHSRLSEGERYDQWLLALNGDVDVVVGARSALFAPVRELGLVVIDEEHEGSYKQSSSPRYHAREVAQRLCEVSGAVLVLGSATPSMESRSRAESGRYSRVLLPERVGGGSLPAVEVVDMGAEFQEGHRSMFSRRLIEGLERVKERSDKAVLFLNRRGYASFLLCRECGFVPECGSCSVSLTYHEDSESLVCHHCGHNEGVPAVCPRCGSAFLRRFGAGTQRVEEELQSILPGMPVVRMDADTTSGKGGHERALMEFEALESGILLGTQMVAKGLDYPEVTLVGVINADTTMHIPDFRAAERTYQLLEQVSGRAGRGAALGTVVIQTYWPDHEAIRAVVARDPGRLYAVETSTRRELGYPPYGRLMNVVVTSASLEECRSSTADLCMSLGEALPEGWSVLGPAPAPIARLKGRYRWHVIVKAPADASIGEVLGPALAGFRVPDDVVVTADVDPIDLV